MRVAGVVVDIPTRAIDSAFDYAVAEGASDIEVGSCVLVEFGNRPVVGYVVSLADTSRLESLKPVREVLGGPYFGSAVVETAEWIAREYVSPLSEALRLFLPPGGVPKAVKVAHADRAGGTASWTLKRAEVGPVDDRWAQLTDAASGFAPRGNATTQRAVLDALSQGPVRVAELAADLGSVDGALRRLADAGVARIERRRRTREAIVRERAAARPDQLSAGQTEALQAIEAAITRGCGEVVVLDGVTGSGKTEVYLRAIERAVASGGSACVLVPEISLTPQTVGRFRSRFGDEVAVLHSRLSPGERFDQWDQVRRRDAHIVVGARSALFAPMADLKLIVIDEEHEPSYKQGQSPRYHARDVAAHLAKATGAALVLGSATPSMESRYLSESGTWRRVVMPQRVTGRGLPPVEVVDMSAEFASGNRSMFSRPLAAGLREVAEKGEKAALFLNRRGFASFLLCRECGFVPECESCATSLTYHEVGSRLSCHHCGATRPVPGSCPRCGSPYLRQFGAGTQRVESELAALLPAMPIIRMDADTTKGKGGHERALARFEEHSSAVLLGTQMIAKGLDYPEVTLVGVINADTTLHIPDFRAAERTFQLLEQVEGRAGRGKTLGTVVVQTYWPDHPAIRAAASHDPGSFYPGEELVRRELGYPPFGRLANLLAWGTSQTAVAASIRAVSGALRDAMPDDWVLLGPGPAPLAKLKTAWRWHALVKAPRDADMSGPLSAVLGAVPRPKGVSVAIDVDPYDLM